MSYQVHRADRRYPEANSRDAELIALGRQFDAITTAVANAIKEKDDLASLLEKLGPIETRITSMPAKTTEGLCVKARASCWAL